jgi:DHA1 family bicyclomycin/chloramphenicol resistance-like MFS transporter
MMIRFSPVRPPVWYRERSHRFYAKSLQPISRKQSVSMNASTSKTKLGFGESITLMALLISLTALSIDIMLPALPRIGRDLHVRNANDVQLIISALIFGLSIGQIFYGPLSDSKGRKPLLFLGIAIFIIGCALCLFSTGFAMMLAGRVLQGMGLAGPRSMVLALVRDQYQGRTMARMMSSIMAVFILVPAIAPAIGQGIIVIAGWRAIFGSLLALALIALTWFGVRQPETLLPRYRIPFSIDRVARAAAEVCRNRIALGYTIVAGFIMGAFLGYLNSAQQIFQELYRLGNRFPLFFGLLTLAIGSASFFNARIVMRYGMRRLTQRAMKLLASLSIFYLAIFYWMDGHPPFGLLMACLMTVLFCFGILFGNLNAIAMTPLGHIAGTGSAVVGSLSTFIAVPLAIVIGRCYDGTILPLIGGFAILSFFSTFIMRWAEKGRTPAGLDQMD